MEKKNLLIISDNYPSTLHPTKGLFVYQLVQELSKQYAVEVIVPTVFFKNKLQKDQKLHTDQAHVIFTNYFSFSGIKFKIVERFVQWSKQRAVMKASRKLYQKPHIMYTHFLWNAIPAIALKMKLQCPLFVAMGESSTGRYDHLLGNEFTLRVLNHITGFVVVSDHLLQYVSKILKVDNSKILLAPNGVNHERFYPRDRVAMREKFGWDQHLLILSFVGAFIERKGVFDLVEAAQKIEKVGVVCIGKGTLNPGSQILFAGKVPNESIAEYLSASDIFVFPTRAEGSSNALLEAMACGLPIISSYIPEVIHQIGTDNAILIPPGAQEALQDAIRRLQQNPELRAAYGTKAFNVSKKYNLAQRAITISQWMESKI